MLAQGLSWFLTIYDTTELYYSGVPNCFLLPFDVCKISRKQEREKSPGYVFMILRHKEQISEP